MTVDTINVTAVVDASYPFINNITLDSMGNPVFHPCLTSIFMETLEIAMNRSFVATLTEQWGDFNESTGKWDGMIAHLIEGKADIAMSALIDVPERRSVADFSFAILSSSYSAYYRYINYQTDPNGLLKPLRNFSWQLVLACLAVALSLLLCTTLESQSILDRVDQSCEKSYKEQEISLSFVHAVGLLCSRSLSLSLRSKILSGELILFAASLSGFLLSSIYTGTVLLFLTEKPQAFHNLDQLLATPYTFGFANFYPMIQLFKEHQLPSIRTVYARGEVQFDTLQDAKSALLRGSYAYFEDTWSGYEALEGSFTEPEKRLVGTLQLDGLSKYFAIATVKNSRYKRAVDYHIIKFKQYGLNNLWIRRFVPNRPDPVHGRLEGINFRGVVVAFYGMAIGGTAAIVFLGTECALYLFSNKMSGSGRIVLL